jgi:hypothetical protein
MANILKAIYQSDNFKPNSKTIDITVTLDGDIPPSDINLYLPNNGDRYQTIDNIAYLPTESSAVVVCLTYKFYCSFIAESGSINSNTKMQEGRWEAFAKVPYLV